MQKGSAPARSGRPARNAPSASHRAETRASTAEASNDLSIIGTRSAPRPGGAADFRVDRSASKNAGQPAPTAARRGGFKPHAAAQVNKRTNVRLAGRPNDPLDLGADQPLDDSRQVFVEPRLEHRAQHFPRHAFGQFRGPGGQIGRERLEGRGDGLVGLGRQEGRLVLGRAFGRRRGRSLRLRFGLAPDDLGRARLGGRLGPPQGGGGLGFRIDDLGRRLSGAPFISATLAGSRSSAMIVRMEARISSIDGSCARCARRTASCSRLSIFALIALMPNASATVPPSIDRRASADGAA